MEFYVLSEEETISKADYLINKTWSLSDPISGSLSSNCSICVNIDCLGHFGLLDLGDYYVNPLFKKQHRDQLKLVCKRCNIKCSGEKSICISCKTLSRHSEDYVIPDSMHSIRYILVPPPSIRSSEDVEWKTDLYNHYNTLVHSVKNKNKNRIYENIEKIQDALIDFLSGKDGIIRKICYGKRLEGSARSVITCDPFIDIDQVHVPKIIANNLYVEKTLDGTEDPEGMYFDKGIPVEKWHIYKGLKVISKLKDGDIVMMNRQPTLSYQSMLAFRALIRKDDIKTFGIHPSVTQTFNADFDGDEMNMFVFPQSSDIKRCLITNFKECIKPIQDEKTAAYLGFESYEELDSYGLTVKLSDIANKTIEGSGLDIMMKAGAKGNQKNIEQMIDKVGDQYVYGKMVGSIKNSYYSGLTPDEYFMHQMASREGIVVQGVTTSDTGYLNRKGCHVFADVIEDKDGIVRDGFGVISF